MDAIVNNEPRRRFEMPTPGGVAVLDYRLAGTTLYLTHAEVPRSDRGQGIAGLLTEAAVRWAREGGYRIVPLCGYVASYLDRHPEHSHLLA